MKYFAFYGTLRTGEYNHERCLMKHGKLIDGVEYITTARLTNLPYKMLDLGGYPMVVREDTKKDLTIEVFKIDNEAVASRIERMEQGAGYELEKVDVELKDGTIITCDMWVGSERAKNIYQSYNVPVITSGDWVNKNTEQHKHEAV